MTSDRTIIISPTGRRSLKKLPKSVQKIVLEKILKLRSDPLLGEKLQGSVNFLRSLHTRVKNSDYRVAYEFVSNKATIVIHYISTRENFYKELLRLRLKPEN